jgi:hypothetical protein
MKQQHSFSFVHNIYQLSLRRTALALASSWDLGSREGSDQGFFVFILPVLHDTLTLFGKYYAAATAPMRSTAALLLDDENGTGLLLVVDAAPVSWSDERRVKPTDLSDIHGGRYSSDKN